MNLINIMSQRRDNPEEVLVVSLCRYYVRNASYRNGSLGRKKKEKINKSWVLRAGVVLFFFFLFVGFLNLDFFFSFMIDCFCCCLYVSNILFIFCKVR